MYLQNLERIKRENSTLDKKSKEQPSQVVSLNVNKSNSILSAEESMISKDIPPSSVDQKEPLTETQQVKKITNTIQDKFKNRM